MKSPLLDCNKNRSIVNGLVQFLARHEGSICTSDDDYIIIITISVDMHQREKVIYVSKKI